jgi:hypothetical protein
MASQSVLVVRWEVIRRDSTVCDTSVCERDCEKDTHKIEEMSRKNWKGRLSMT